MFHQKVAGIYRGIPPKKKLGGGFVRQKTMLLYINLEASGASPFVRFFLTKKRWIPEGSAVYVSSSVGCSC